jgi:hypothetical protein
MKNEKTKCLLRQCWDSVLLGSSFHLKFVAGFVANLRLINSLNTMTSIYNRYSLHYYQIAISKWWICMPIWGFDFKEIFTH